MINPEFILGPALVMSGNFPSSIFHKSVLDGTLPGIPRSNFGIVDVRDVALAHLRAIEV